MKLKPLGDRLIVRAIDEEETTASGLVLPDTAKEKPQKGEVQSGTVRVDRRSDLSRPDFDPVLHAPLPWRLAPRWHSLPSSASPSLPNVSLEVTGHMSLKLKPLGDRLIVRAIEEEETTASGLVLPDTAKEKPQKGEVLAAGDGKINEDTGKRTPLDVAKGDTVLYSKYGGTEIKVDGEELLVLRESDVLAKII